jgi:hypothetical protein
MVTELTHLSDRGGDAEVRMLCSRWDRVSSPQTSPQQYSVANR